MRVAIYSRYSSDLQDPRSIADQIATARDHAQRQGWTVTAEYQDAAISGASTKNRPGLSTLMRDAGEHKFDAVLTESVDRLSRDLEDIAGIHKRLAFVGVKIVTLADGEVGKMHVGLKGMIASMFLDDLALKTKRGQVGRVKAGKIPGGRCYGYDVVPSIDNRGERKINEAEAGIVRRIFDEYLLGRTPLQMATQLNAEGVPSPRGGAWNASTINGSRKRMNGILNNRLYAGKIVYNRQSFVKDPSTGKRQARENPRDQWLEQDVPDLRIIVEDVFAAVVAKRAELGGARPEYVRRPKHLFSGLIFCGCCGASMIVYQKNYLGCSAVANRGTCTNRRNISTDEISRRVLDAVKANLLTPERVQMAVETYRAERERLAKANARDRRAVERDLAAVERKIKALLTMVENGSDPRAAAIRMNELEAERRELDRSLPRKDEELVSLHPRAAEKFAETVRTLESVLSAGSTQDVEAIGLIRELIQRIVASPTPKGDPMKLEVSGNLAVLLEPTVNSVSTAMVAGARNIRCRTPVYVTVIDR